MSARAAHGALFALSLLAVALYWPALHGPLLLDDSHVIDPLLSDTGLARTWPAYLVGETGPLGRPLAMASFIVNALLAGNDIFYWKAANLLLHVAIAWVVYALFAILAGACGTGPRLARATAVCGAGLWLLHPLNVSTVMYLSQRMTQLSTLFALLAILLYAHARCQGIGTPRARVALAAAFLVCIPLAILSKETGVLTPFYLAAVELIVFTAPTWPRPRWLTGLLAATTLLPALAAVAWLASDFERYFLDPYTLRDFTPAERVLTELRILVTYLGWIVAPRRTAFGFYHDDVRVSHSLFGDASAAVALALLLAIAASAWYCRRRAPLAALGIAIFFLGHALESTVFGLELMFEHRNYLPAIGIVLCGCGLALALARPRASLAVASIAGLLFAAVTAATAAVWGNEPALYASFLGAHPQSVRARVTLAEWSAAQGDFEAAMALVAGDDRLTLRLHALRIECARSGGAGAGAAAVLADAGAAPRLEHFAQEVLLLLARQVLDGDCRLDIADVVAAVDGARDRPLPPTRRYRYYIVSALLWQRLGEQARADERLASATELDRSDPYPWYLAAEWAADAGDYTSARARLAEARTRAQSSPHDFTRIDAAVVDLIARR